MKALIHDNKVIQLSENTFPVNEKLIWVDAPEGCEVGWIKTEQGLRGPEKNTPSRETRLKNLLLQLLDHIEYIAHQHGFASASDALSYEQSALGEFKTFAAEFSVWRDSTLVYGLSLLQDKGITNIDDIEDIDFIKNIPEFLPTTTPLTLKKEN